MTPPGAARDQLAALVHGDVGWATSWRHAIGTMDADRVRDAAVLVLFGVLDSSPSAHRAAAVARDLDVLLLARAPTLGQHAGQVAFPGGRVDPGDDGPVGAALREAVEETGLDASGVEVLGTFPPLPLPVSNHLVTPVLGWWATPTPVRVVDVGESAQVFRVPVADLVDPENRRTVVAHRGSNAYRAPGFVVRAEDREHLIWGFTAGVLDALLDRLGWAEPWDGARTLDLSL
ncbi:CoA pyrophosphatase [Luteimicrobium xylanilyticum]|uniref:Putative Nudix hydrolase NudL n=1 Tax=Luteimicrobium xylanilyticum TaxID=1133546 RepID=A0A5P9QAI9_9MICO|nr:putative Nudix hydrolase NudL [Luteimicrobium xylanilyticum]